MSKKIIISAVASMAVAGGLYAASATGTGSSTITAGSDINGTVHSAKIASATTTLYASDSNITSAAGVGDANYAKFITYVPNIAVGSGNLITIRVNNGAILSNSGNELWLVDANSTAEQNATGAPVVAKMTDYVDSASNYSEMTFKFLSNVDSGAQLVLVNKFDTNATLVADLGADYGLGSRTSALGLVVNSGLACAENVTLEVINSKDQSADWFNVPNTAGVSSTGVTVAKGVYIKLGVDGDQAAQGGSTYDGPDYATTACPTFNCEISISDDEKAFGSSSAASASVCPTCTPTLSNTQDLTCQGSFYVDYASGYITNGNLVLSSIDVTTTTSAATMDELSSIKGELNDNATSKTFTIASSNMSASASMTAGLLTSAANKVELTYTADGTSVLTPAAFDIAVKVNTSVDVDSITGFMEFTEQGTPLGISYLSANPDYRSFVRVTSTTAATIQAIVTTEDGSKSSRVDVTTSTGDAVSIGANGGAVVVEAADLLRSAQDAGFTGTGMRFNATLYVKTTGTVDAVAFGQTASGSQRYLPVNGATGGKK